MHFSPIVRKMYGMYDSQIAYSDPTMTLQYANYITRIRINLSQAGYMDAVL